MSEDRRDLPEDIPGPPPGSDKDEGPGAGLPPGAALPPGPRDQMGFADLPPPPKPAIATAAAEPETAPAGAGDSPPAGEPEGGRMGLLDHLEELRKVLIQSLVAMGAAAILCWAWSAQLLELVIRPVSDVGVYFTAPNDAFMARLKVAMVTGLFVVAPFVLFRAYGFVLPGLHRRERRVATPILLWTVGLFYTGVAFAFFVVAPYVIKFMMGFGTETLKPLIGVGSYLGFVARLCLGFGLVFELPMLVLALCVAGIVRPQTLLRTWRYAIVIISVIAAVFTPPDVISQVMMMAPMMILYLGSVLVALVVVRRRDRAHAARDAAAGDAAAEGD